MRVNHKSILAQRPLSYAIFQIVCLYSRTFRLNVINEQQWHRYLEKGGKVLLCTWHQQFFSAIRHFRNYRKYQPHLMISPSRDGDIIAGVAKLAGWHPVRGSSSKQGREALKELVHHLRKTHLAAMIVDGPRGPMGVVKAGAVRLAHLTDAMIVPFYISTDKAWTFNSWDRFFIPKPFTSVTLQFGEMLRLEEAHTSESFEAQRQELETIMRTGLRQEKFE